MDEIECPDCDGTGDIWNNNDPTSGQRVDCDECKGTGWRAPTDEERDDMAANAFSDMCEGEPPITAQERHEAAWKQKRALR